MFNKTCSRCLCHINYFVFFFLFLAGASSLQAAPSPANPTSEIGADSSAFQQHSKPHAVPESILPPVQLPAEEETISPQAALKEFFVKKITLEGVNEIPLTELQPILSKFENKNLNLVQLYAIAQNITQYYRLKGFITSRAYVPPQEIEDGVVVIKVVEGKVGKVSISGNKYIKTDWLLGYVTLKSGAVIQYSQLMQDLTRLNSNPDRQVKAALAPGAVPGTSDIILTAQEQNPLHFAYTIDDYGTRLTTVTGQTLLTAGNNIALDGANQLNGIVNLSGDNISINNISALELGNVTATGHFQTTVAGNLTQAADTSIDVTGSTTLAAGSGNNITLTNGLNDFNTVTITSGNNVNLSDVNSINLDEITAAGAVNVTAGGAITSTGSLATNVTAGASSSLIAGSYIGTLTAPLKVSITGILSVTASGEENGYSGVMTGTATALQTVGIHPGIILFNGINLDQSSANQVIVQDIIKSIFSFCDLEIGPKNDRFKIEMMTSLKSLLQLTNIPNISLNILNPGALQSEIENNENDVNQVFQQILQLSSK